MINQKKIEFIWVDWEILSLPRQIFMRKMLQSQQTV